MVSKTYLPCLLYKLRYSELIPNLFRIIPTLQGFDMFRPQATPWKLPEMESWATKGPSCMFYSDFIPNGRATSGWAVLANWANWAGSAE